MKKNNSFWVNVLGIPWVIFVFWIMRNILIPYILGMLGLFLLAGLIWLFIYFSRESISDHEIRTRHKELEEKENEHNRYY